LAKSISRSSQILRSMAFLLIVSAAVLYVVLPARAVTLELQSGGLISGFLGEVKEDVVILYRPQPHMVDLEQIVQVIPSDGSDPAVDSDLPERIRTLNRLIDHKATAYNRFQRQARTLLAQGNYDALEALAVDAWASAERTASGEWLLNAYYAAFDEDLTKRDVDAHQHRRQQILNWCEARPESAHALTALLSITVDLAWAHRGTSYIGKVSRKDRGELLRLMTEAEELARRLAQRTDLDSAMLYQISRVATSVAPRFDGDLLSVFALAERMAALEGDYHHAYFGLVRKTLPRWGGSVEEMDQLLAIVTASLPAEQRAQAYYHMANSVLVRYGSKEYVKFDFDWALIRAGYESWINRWPSYDLSRHQFAAMAYLEGEHDVVRHELGSVHPGWNYVAESVWLHPEALAEVRQWSNDAGVKSPSSSEKTPNLIAGLRAIGQGDQPGLMTYLQKGGNPDARDETGRTLLQHAVDNGDKVLAYALISSGADVLRTNSDGWQAVHYAAAGNGHLILEMLEQAGATMNVANNRGDTPLMIAADKTNRAGFQWLLERFPQDVNDAGGKGYNPLLHTAYDGHVDLVAKLLSVDGINVNAQTLAGNTALHLAALRGNEGVVRLLLAAGADVAILNNRNRSVLAMAQKSGNAPMVGYLQQKGLVAVSGFSDESFYRSNEFVKEANALYLDGNMAQAAVLYKQGIAEYPTSTSAHVGLALSLWMDDKPEQAMISIKTAISTDPENAELYYKAGRIAYSLDDRDAYMGYFTRYAKMAPNTHNTKDLYERLPELASN